MSISDKSRKAMESLGLTSYETKVYLCLLEIGSMRASDISKKSGVPYSKIYEVLNSLEDKGWLETDSSRPQKFFPKSPLTALEAMRMRIENGIRDSESLIISELMPIYEKSGIREKPEIWVVRGIYNIASKETNTDTVRAISRIADVRLKNNMFGGGVIGDSKQVMILLGEGRSDNTNLEPIAIWAEHTGLARFAKDYFHYLWADASNKEEEQTSDHPRNLKRQT